MQDDTRMKIAIIGAGNVGTSLAKAFAARGHSIYFGVRNPASDKARAALANLRDKAVMTNIPDAVLYGDLIVLAVGWPDAGEIVRGIAGQLKGKIVIDATNVFGAAIQRGRSAAETLAEIAPGAQVVKCFNTIGAEHYLDPEFMDRPAQMFLCGDDADAKSLVGWLASDIGFDPIDAGPLANAEMLEAMARLWVYFTRSGMGRDIAFRLIRK